MKHALQSRSSSSESSSRSSEQEPEEPILYYAGLPYRPRTSPPKEPEPPSEPEAAFYYSGLPSRPRLVARTSTTIWEVPRFPMAFGVTKQLQPVYEHPIQEFWEHGLAAKIHQHLDLMMVKWTSTDVVRIDDAEKRDKSTFPVILWIGIVPKSLPSHKGVNVAVECRKILQDHGISDIHVEIRESVVARSAGHKLFPPAEIGDPMADIRDPLATTVGLRISAEKTPHVEGTGGFFFTEGSDTTRLFLVTARHVVFPPIKSTDKEKDDNGEQNGKNEVSQPRNDGKPRYNVMLLGDTGFSGYLKSIQNEIQVNRREIEYLERYLKSSEGKDDQYGERERKQFALATEHKVTELLRALQKDVPAYWSNRESRIIGHVISPPIMANASNEDYYEDWAVIEIDPSKIDSNNFRGNAINFSTDVYRKYFPMEVRRTFRYPVEGLFKLQGTIPDEELRRPPKLENDDEDASIIVLKCGIESGLTIGRANGIVSYTRENGTTSKEWPILPLGLERGYFSGAFSEQGDSGSVIFDGRGRIGGLLTGGSFGHLYPSRDNIQDFAITYATPISFLLNRMRDMGFRPNLDPVLTP